MVAAAANHSGVSAIRGAAQRMPLSDRTMDVVYFHLSIHYGDWRRAFDESLRVVKPGGAIWVWTLGPDHHASSFLRRWFPRIEELDRVRFPDPEVMAHYLRRRATVTLGSEVEAKTRPAGEWAAAVRAGFVSTLQLLTPAETAAGMRAFAEAYPDPAAPVEYALRWTWLKVRS